MKKIAFVPARGGSKSIPFKNIKQFCGKPLIYWTLNALQECNIIDEIIVATDSTEIEYAVLDMSFDKVSIYHRLPVNASDCASTESVILEYIENSKLSDDNLFILVQATSPLTKSIHIEGGLELYNTGNYDSILSCVRSYRFLWTEDGNSLNYNFVNRPRRQDFKGDLMENGAFYISTVKNIKTSKNRISGKIGIYEMPEYTAYEIDEPDDWDIVERIMLKYNISEKVTNIKLFLSDVDGTLTDAGMYYSEDGNEMKKFNTHDGLGFSLLRKNKIKIGIITSENTTIIKNRANKLNVDFLYQGRGYIDKLNIATTICKELDISLNEVAYIGDDINCIELLKNVGLKACPSDALDKVKRIPFIKVMKRRGGQGCVREFIDYILEL